jgi:hypothetical protein
LENIYFHSNHDPIKESSRLIENLKKNPEASIYIFFGAGLGYTILEALKRPNITCIWMEPYPEILKQALSNFDFSNTLKSGKLKILIKPFTEDRLYAVFKGFGNTPVTFIPHRPSLAWKEEDYKECKYICEKFFHKKDANIATLSRFETIWTKNILLNLPDLQHLKPVSTLFGIAKDVPILVCGAGPSLYNDLDSIKKFRDHFILIVVDTALHVLTLAGIDPDLIFSVDPQPINRSYLEGYKGDAKIIFDPTSTYHSLHYWLPKNGFFTSSPFPLINIFTNSLSVPAGDVPYGGSVSTNAVSLADLMEAKDVLIIGQDLAFTGGFAHCKGAILEERLNYFETRFFRRELHNYRQIHALQKISIPAYDGSTVITNEKMQIFRKWFVDRSHSKNWINVTSSGGVIDKIPRTSLEEYFSKNNFKDKVQRIKNEINNIFNQTNSYLNHISFKSSIDSAIIDLRPFSQLLIEGKYISEKIYLLVQKNSMNSDEFQKLLDKMDDIDNKVSSKKGLNEFIGLGVQRVVLAITEGYETNLSVDEKKNKQLGIARKSILLYSGLLDSANLILKLLVKVRKRLS